MSKWEMVRLSDVVAETITGEWGAECVDGEKSVKVLRTTNFTNLGVVSYNRVVVRSIPASKVDKKKLERFDIILEKSGGSDNQPVGRVVFFDNRTDEIYLCNNFTQILRVDQNIAFPKYVFRYLYHLHQNGTTELLQNKTTGIRNLQLKSYMALGIPLPPLPVQQQIADVLDRASALIEKRKAQIEKLDLLVKSQFIEMFGDPVTNPKGWDIAEIGELASLQGGYAFKSNDYVDNGIKLVQISNVHKDALTWDEVNYVPYGYEKKYHQFLLKNGDIVIAMTRPIIKSLDAVKIAQVSIGDGVCLLNQRVGRFIINSAASTNFFLLEFCKTQYFRNRVEAFSSVSLQPNISSKQIESIACYCPPLTLQNKYAEFVQQVEPQKTLLQQSLAKLEQNYKSLMQKCFRGEVF